MAKTKQSNTQEQRQPNLLRIDERYLLDGEAEKYRNAPADELAMFNDKLVARTLAQPEVRAARTIQRFEGENLDINACADELRKQVAEVQSGNMKRPEAMLIAQAHTLDALFSSLVLRSQANSRDGYLDAADRYMRLALKAQAQSVRTLEALSELKNPRPVAFVRQANIAHGPQQVNNGMAPPARETETMQTQLSGGTHELLPDARSSGNASRVNQEVEALGEIHRAEVHRR